MHLCRLDGSDVTICHGGDDVQPRPLARGGACRGVVSYSISAALRARVGVSGLGVSPVRVGMCRRLVKAHVSNCGLPRAEGPFEVIRDNPYYTG